METTELFENAKNDCRRVEESFKNVCQDYLDVQQALKSSRDAHLETETTLQDLEERFNSLDQSHTKLMLDLGIQEQKYNDLAEVLIAERVAKLAAEKSAAKMTALYQKEEQKVAVCQTEVLTARCKNEQLQTTVADLSKQVERLSLQADGWEELSHEEMMYPEGRRASVEDASDEDL